MSDDIRKPEIELLTPNVATFGNNRFALAKFHSSEPEKTSWVILEKTDGDSKVVWQSEAE